MIDTRGNVYRSAAHGVYTSPEETTTIKVEMEVNGLKLGDVSSREKGIREEHISPQSRMRDISIEMASEIRREHLPYRRRNGPDPLGDLPDSPKMAELLAIVDDLGIVVLGNC